MRKWLIKLGAKKNQVRSKPQLKHINIILTCTYESTTAVISNGKTFAATNLPGNNFC